MNIRIALLAIACLSSTPAWSINKCTIDGRTVFQDAPCPGKGEALNVRPAAGNARAPSTPNTTTDGASPSKQLTEAQRIEANVATSQKERRLRDLEQREVPGADAAIHAHLQACKEEQERFEVSKRMYVQNLYGKTDAAQKASEQAAAAARCDTKDRDLRERAATLRAECQQIGGCK